MMRGGFLSGMTPTLRAARSEVFLIRSNSYRNINAIEGGAMFHARSLARLARDRERQARAD